MKSKLAPSTEEGSCLCQVGHVAIKDLVQQQVVNPARPRGRQFLDQRRQRLHNDRMVDHARAVLVQRHHIEPERCELTVLLGCEVPASRVKELIALQ